MNLKTIFTQDSITTHSFSHGHHPGFGREVFVDIKNFKSSLKFLLTDIDDTLTDDGRLGTQSYEALWDLQESGIKVIPVTGRPAGWCEMIARQWPVAGVVGENGAFWFRYDDRQMRRGFAVEEGVRKQNELRLKDLQSVVLQNVPGSAVASDQFCRLFDLAIDFCEDVDRLSENEIRKIVRIFEQAGAQAKISSIHVNAWFGQYNKLTQSLEFLKTQFGLFKEEELQSLVGFSGDSPNDEPMWSYFQNSFAVANVKDFLPQLKSPPKWISQARGGKGFAEIAKILIANHTE